MKVTLVILACLAVVAVSAVSIQKSNYTVDKGFLEKQKFLYEIVYRVEDPLLFEEWIKSSEKLIRDESKYVKFDVDMKNFMDTVKINGLLPQGEFFSELHKTHYLQGSGLFNFFYYAKDWETFVHNVAWARLHVNEGMFVYALTLAVIHRPDMKGLILPSIYEIFPQMFFNSKFVMKAEKFNMDVWNRQVMLEKELKTIYHKEHATEFVGNRFYMKDWKTWQWWKLMGLDETWQLEEKTVLRNNIEIFQSDPKYKDVWAGIKAFWLPVDYTRDIGIFNKESKLSYFTEDVGLNAYWYYLNMDYSTLLNNKQLNNKRRGEYWMYKTQQILARYRMERISQGLPETSVFRYEGIVEDGYDPQLISYNGNGYTFRKNYFEVQTSKNSQLIQRVRNIERRIKDIIDSGKFVTRDGVVIDITKPESIEYVGTLMQGNVDILDKQFFGYWYAYVNLIAAGSTGKSFTTTPNVLLNFETMLRDPVSYCILEGIVEVINKVKNLYSPYKREELLLPGVKIDGVEVGKLGTYFDLVDFDVTNLLNQKMTFHDGNFVWDTTLLARQMHLNHIPFEINLKVTASKAQRVIVSTFLIPDLNEIGQEIDMFEKTENVFELDKFGFDLTEGQNVIKRNSRDFSYTVSDQTTYTELYKYVMLALDGKQDYSLKIAQPHCGFPNRLILPRGWVQGMPMKLFFIITPVIGKEEQSSTYVSDTGVRYLGDLPFGFPFDRKIQNVYEFLVPNMFIKDVKIFHTEKYVKYYPQKYEHFGTFDYNY